MTQVFVVVLVLRILSANQFPVCCFRKRFCFPRKGFCSEKSECFRKGFCEAGCSLIRVYFDKGLYCNYHVKGNVSEKGFVKMGSLSSGCVFFVVVFFFFCQGAVHPSSQNAFLKGTFFRKGFVKRGGLSSVWSFIRGSFALLST